MPKAFVTNSLFKHQKGTGAITAIPKHIVGYIRTSEGFELRNYMSDSKITEAEATDFQNESGTAFADGDAFQTELDSILGI